MADNKSNRVYAFLKMYICPPTICAEIQVPQGYSPLHSIVYKVKKPCLIGPKSNFLFFSKKVKIGRKPVLGAGLWHLVPIFQTEGGPCK